MDGLLGIDFLQWPAMAVTLLAAWLVGSTQRRRRLYGFGCFIASNLLWIIWGWHSAAYALMVLQVGLFAMNLRGAGKQGARDHGVDLQPRPDSSG